MPPLERIRPLIPRHWLFAVSALVWCCAGSILCGRAWFWMAELPAGRFFLIESVGAVGAVIAFAFGFVRITRRNIARIDALPERSSLFAFTGLRGYMLIVLMMSTGIILRNSSVSREILAVPYTAMGGSLLLGSAAFLRRFLRAS